MENDKVRRFLGHSVYYSSTDIFLLTV